MEDSNQDAGTHNPFPRHLVSLGKRIAPLLAIMLARGPLARVVRSLEAYLAFIQGKGSGTGWDLDAEVRVAASRLRRANAVIFDVGAHCGEWSARLLRSLGSTIECRLFLFEPLPSCQNILRSRNLPGTILIGAAVGDRNGCVTLFSPDDHSPVASVYPRRDSYLQGYAFVQHQVRIVTIDQIVADLGIDLVDFVKLDIEGNEVAALRGATKCLASNRIRALSFEFGSPNINSRTYFHDLWDILHSFGYQIKRIAPGGILVPIERYYEDLEYFRGVTNYLAEI